MNDDDGAGDRHRHEAVLAQIRNGTSRHESGPRKRNPVPWLMLAGLAAAGALAIEQAARDRAETERFDRLAAASDRDATAQCEIIRDLIKSDDPPLKKARQVDKAGLFDVKAHQFRDSVMPSWCINALRAGQTLVSDEIRSKETRYVVQPGPTSDPSDSAGAVDCSALGAWVADGQESGRFTRAEYEGWLEIVSDCDG